MIRLDSFKPVNIKLPHVHRYMGKKFIDAFFDKGLIRVSSFKRFKEYPDEIRGDKQEGGGTFRTHSIEGSQHLIMTDTGSNKYLMSGSLAYDKGLLEIFKVDGVIRINDPVNFAISIMNSIAGSTECFVGFCSYQEYRIVNKKVKEFSNKDDMTEKGEMTILGPKFNERMNETIGNGIDLLYLKEIKYQPQMEFRFVWTVNSNFYKINDYIDLECKEAIQFCERL